MVLTLHGHPMSTCTQRVAVILKEKNVPFKFVVVDFEKGEHKSPSFVSIQPFGQVPYIDDDGFKLYESRAIGRYIAVKYASQGAKLLPDVADLQKWALFEQAASIELTNFEPSAHGLAWEIIFKNLFSNLETDTKAVENHKQTLAAKLDAYEVILSKSKYLAGDEITLADLFHLPYGDMFGAFGVDFLKSDKRPNVARWWKDISSRPSWESVKNGI
ncbi:hypothetical protein A0H81_11995 [Grifola frondosa]|uniref:glutathione transferase n=1 Tax=Grifola frondosa TaxID=5627 RepID=A0A1C7LTE4_GRIFR|nr:hypothetical protein A0H81_11995 [Grifola frondosa]